MQSSRPAATRVASVSRPELVFARLRRSEDFRRVLGSGSRRRRGGLVVVSAPGLDGVIRVGLVVGRKVGKAVLRNRARRRLRHAAAAARLTPGFDYVVIASPEVAAAPFTDLLRWLEEGAAR